mmetsp:Transcript_86781/g.241515  ORF Transcript_86781/g.241515 Transcript_86781/m.241515 type:complete len:240 (+) Transcript_86781:90-809(+)
MADEEPLEYTLLYKRDAKVYRIPPAAGADGHRAGDWQEAIWKGSVRVIGRGKDLTIKLLDNSSGSLFAQCVIPNGEHEKFVERVVDSSRYWVLKIVNGARHAFIGFGFSDRSDAFDFNVCLQDFKSTFVDRDRDSEEAKITAPMKDLSLKEGEKITVKIPGAEGARRRPAAGAGPAGGPIGLLAPPPPAGGGFGLAAPPAPAASAAFAALAASGDDDFADDFADFQSAAALQSGPPVAS